MAQLLNRCEQDRPPSMCERYVYTAQLSEVPPMPSLYEMLVRMEDTRPKTQVVVKEAVDWRETRRTCTRCGVFHPAKEMKMVRALGIMCATCHGKRKLEKRA